MSDWEVTVALSNALGYPMNYRDPSEIMDEIARLTPTFAGVSFEKIDRMGSLQWPCNDAAPEGTPIMHVDEFVRGKGRFMLTEYVPTREKVNAEHPLILTTGRILSQYNVGAQTRRTENSMWHEEDRLKSIHTTRKNAASTTATGSASPAAAAKPCCAPRSPTACSRAWSTPRSTSPAPAPT